MHSKPYFRVQTNPYLTRTPIGSPFGYPNLIHIQQKPNQIWESSSPYVLVGKSWISNNMGRHAQGCLCVQGEDSVKEKKGYDFSCNPMCFFQEREKKKLIILDK